MAAILKYFDRSGRAFHANKRRFGREEAQARAAYSSRTVYIGNLAWATHDSQIEQLFAMAGPVEKVIMGLNKETKKPCGFAFVIYWTRSAAVQAVLTLNGASLDDRPIKVEMDKGFNEGRQFGRGATGGQMRDELREDYDEGRGGWSTKIREAMEAQATGEAGGAAESPAAGAYRGGQDYRNSHVSFNYDAPAAGPGHSGRHSLGASGNFSEGGDGGYRGGRGGYRGGARGRGRGGFQQQQQQQEGGGPAAGGGGGQWRGRGRGGAPRPSFGNSGRSFGDSGRSFGGGPSGGGNNPEMAGSARSFGGGKRRRDDEDDNDGRGDYQNTNSSSSANARGGGGGGYYGESGKDEYGRDRPNEEEREASRARARGLDEDMGGGGGRGLGGGIGDDFGPADAFGDRDFAADGGARARGRSEEREAYGDRGRRGGEGDDLQEGDGGRRFEDAGLGGGGDEDEDDLMAGERRKRRRRESE